MSPRPPPKISLRHEWTRELGHKVVREPEGEVARQPEGEVAREAKFFQPAQPTPNPIRDRAGRLADMQDGRNTSRSQEIGGNSLNEELSRFFSLWVLLLPSLGSQNLLHPVVTLDLRADLQKSLCRCFSDPSQIYLIHEKF